MGGCFFSASFVRIYWNRCVCVFVFRLTSCKSCRSAAFSFLFLRSFQAAVALTLRRRKSCLQLLLTSSTRSHNGGKKKKSDEEGNSKEEGIFFCFCRTCFFFNSKQWPDSAFCVLITAFMCQQKSRNRFAPSSTRIQLHCVKKKRWACCPSTLKEKSQRQARLHTVAHRALCSNSCASP